MEYNETGSAALAVENETEVGGTSDSGVAGGFFSTPAPKLTIPGPTKHRGSVASVQTLLAKTGTGGIEFVFHSDSNGRDYKKTIWVIEQYRDNPNLNAESLNGLPVPEGKKQTPRVRYERTIQNSKGTGELQQIVNLAANLGRTFGQYADFDALGEVLNQSIAGIPVIFTVKAEETENGFDEKVNTVYSYDHNFDKLRGTEPGV